MSQNPPSSLPVRLYRLLIAIGTVLQCPLLLAMRLYWGWQFFGTGKGKLMDLDQPTQYFASLGIPLPHLNAILAGTTECVGGLLLMVGLGSRLVSLPLLFTMAIAYLTAEREALQSIFHDPDKFTGSTPFLFTLTLLIVLAFGPGRLSLDYLIERFWLGKSRLQ